MASGRIRSRRALLPMAATVVAGASLAAVAYGWTPVTPAGPPTFLWAWERPEDLRAVDKRTAGVAVLTRTVTISRERIAVQPRLQPLRVPPGTRVIAVVRIETESSNALNESRTDEVVRAVADAALPQAEGLQIDFDARVSERAQYRRLLAGVRAVLPKTSTLSITALASWCLDDNWLGGLPIDDATPMLFRMGPDERSIRSGLDAGRDFSAAVCRHSVGLSMDEPWPRLPAGRRRFIFNPRAWSAPALRTIVAEARR